MSKVLITVGPIPSRIDSVKYITNRFKGGLAMKTAEMLASEDMDHDVTVCMWRHAQIKTSLPTILVDDVWDYYNKVLDFEADAYILAAAVANIGPSEPLAGKFPSHNYKVGDKFDIKFTIMPRVIDEIKVKYPRATLIGYKLFDAEDDELIKIARETLIHSKANIVFANHPKWAATRKIAVLADGSVIDMNFDDHVILIDKILGEQFYSTTLVDLNTPNISDQDQFIIDNYPKYPQGDLVFGTFGIRKGSGFITTTRDKKQGLKALAYVSNVDHDKNTIFANQKATLNAPMLAFLFQENPVNYIIHGHEMIGLEIQPEYQFPGTKSDLNNAVCGLEEFLIQLPYHGFIAGFEHYDRCVQFIKSLK